MCRLFVLLELAGPDEPLSAALLVALVLPVLVGAVLGRHVVHQPAKALQHVPALLARLRLVPLVNLQFVYYWSSFVTSRWSHLGDFGFGFYSI